MLGFFMPTTKQQKGNTMAFKPIYSKRLGRRQGSRPHSYEARKRIFANGGNR